MGEKAATAIMPSAALLIHTVRGGTSSMMLATFGPSQAAPIVFILKECNMEPITDKIKETLNAVLQRNDWDLYNTSNKVSYSEKLDVGRYELRLPIPVSTHYPYTIIASFELHPMINCCGICVSTKAEVNFSYRRRGLGTLLNSLRIDIARYNGYGLLLCTDREKNEPQRKILEANGWRDIYKFVNPRTKNTVCITVINL
jgi:hypothetical protein